MQVFKVFFKIIRENIGVSLIYLIIFLGLSIFISGSGASQAETLFQKQTIPIAIINHDTHSELVQGLIRAVSQDNTIKEIADTQEAMQDALFFRQVEYILVIPERFTQDFMQGKEVLLGKLTVSDSNSAVYLDMLINQYLSNIMVYQEYTQLDQKEYIKLANDTLQIGVNSSISGDIENNNIKTSMDYYFQYASYAGIAIILFCISSFLMKFNQADTKRRTHCSPLKITNINLQIILSIAICTIVIFLVLILMAVVLYSNEIFSLKGAYSILNLFIFTIFCGCLAFTAGNICKSDNALNGFVNSVALTFCFLGGVFVPQSMLGDKVLLIGSFTPTFWFTKNCDYIATLTNFSFENMIPFLQNSLIVLAFSLVAISIGVLVSRQKKAA